MKKGDIVYLTSDHKSYDGSIIEIGLYELVFNTTHLKYEVVVLVHKDLGNVFVPKTDLISKGQYIKIKRTEKLKELLD